MRSIVFVGFTSLVLGVVTVAPLTHLTEARDVTNFDIRSSGQDVSKSVPALLNYQGYLATADSWAVSDTLAMTFRLFNTATGGSALWSEILPAVAVNSGQFYVLLGSVVPFPADLFDGSTLYLEMEVGADVFSPRKPIVSVAYSFRSDRADTAVYATGAGHAVRADTAAYSPGADSWTASGDNVYRLTGNVGIGTDSPSTKLDVAGNVDADGFSINGTPIGTSSDTYWSKTGDNIHYSAGNVGIGTATPTARLQVEGAKGHTGSLCTSDYAVWGEHSGGTQGSLGSNDYGAYGQHVGSGNEGYLGSGEYGAYGQHTGSGNEGILGSGSWGVYGKHLASGNQGSIGNSDFAVWGQSGSGYGFLGGHGDNNYGVGGITFSATGKGVYGSCSGSSNRGWLGGNDYGAYGQNGTGNYGFFGGSNQGAMGAHNNGNYGTLGEQSYAVLGHNANNNQGFLGHGDYGAGGYHGNGNYGLMGSSDYAVYGRNISTSYGVLGSSDYGAYGQNNGGHYGILGGSNFGAYGANANGNQGYLGDADQGVYGRHDNGNYGALGAQDYAVGGQHNNGNFGVFGYTDAGAYGENSNENFGYLGGQTYGVYGENTNGNCGWIGGESVALQGTNVSGTWVSLAGPLHSGMFHGAVHVQGNLSVEGYVSKGGGSFKIDHPLDPENKYLYHSFVESPDMKDIYDGVAVLDANGRAWVELPEWFESVNRDFRYQLTAIGAPGPNLYIAEKISGNRFMIAGGDPGMEVSWMVTGIRQDPYANLHRIPVEETKPAEERGTYLYPDAYGQPEEKGVAWALNQKMRQATEKRPVAPRREFQLKLSAEETRQQSEQPAMPSPLEDKSTDQLAPKER